MAHIKSLPTPNYVLSEDHTYSHGPHDTKTMPAGTFVRPIELCYVPKHVTEANRWFNSDREFYCYTRQGIIPIPKKIVRKL